MTEPPVRADIDGVTAAPQRIGLRVLDLTIAGAAITLSLISLAVAIGNSRIQARLLAANTWPFIQSYTDDQDDAGKPVIDIGLRNSGVGPAKVESVTMRWRGREYGSNAALLRDCCGAAATKDFAGLQANRVSPAVLTPGQALSFLVYPSSDATRNTWRALRTVREQVSLSVCYCSVFDECWTTDGQNLHPPSVASCPRNAPAFAG